MQTPVTAILLAAGRGERMKSALPKAMHLLCGRPMIDWVLRAAAEAGALEFGTPIAVVGGDGAHIRAYFGERLRYVEQPEPNGEGAALALAAATLGEHAAGRALVLAADLPLLRGETITRLLASASPAAALCAEGADAPETCLPACSFDIPGLLDVLAGLNGGSLTLPDILRAFAQNRRKVEFVCAPAEEALDVNGRVALHDGTKALRRRINRAHMESGVTFLDADTTCVDASVEIGRDCVLYPGIALEGNTSIGEGTTLYPGCRIVDSRIGSFCAAQAVVAHDAVVGDGVKMGPFVNLRPGTRIADRCKIGNYIEVKNSNVGEGSKLPHLSYIGDGDVGKNVNLGCGTVFVNYDGHKKHRTTVGDNAFIGCHTSLVAPVSVGENAFTAAGSVITQDVPPDTLAVARAKQVNKVGYMEKIRQRRE